ncbi:MAG: InlB B-repeat-containing protein, partial [Clostridia bacterium]|nr:InlB B-repeat-containing protein [Clostridia bacterium]
MDRIKNKIILYLVTSMCMLAMTFGIVINHFANFGQTVSTSETLVSDEENKLVGSDAVSTPVVGQKFLNSYNETISGNLTFQNCYITLLENRPFISNASDIIISFQNCIIESTGGCLFGDNISGIELNMTDVAILGDLYIKNGVFDTSVVEEYVDHVITNSTATQGRFNGITLDENLGDHLKNVRYLVANTFDGEKYWSGPWDFVSNDGWCYEVGTNAQNPSQTSLYPTPYIPGTNNWAYVYYNTELSEDFSARTGARFTSSSTTLTADTVSAQITREGYKLALANTSDAKTGELSVELPSTGATYYAIWQPATYSLTIDLNGGESAKSAISPSTIGKDFSVSGNNQTVSYDAKTGTYTVTKTNDSNPYCNIPVQAYLESGKTYRIHANFYQSNGTTPLGFGGGANGSFQIFYDNSNSYSELNSKTLTNNGYSENFTVSETGNYNLRFDNDINTNTVVIKDFWIEEVPTTTSTIVYTDVTFGDYFVLPEILRNGYTLSDWTISDVESGAKVDVSDVGSTIFTMGLRDVTITANWTPTMVEVNLNLGEVETAEPEYVNTTDGVVYVEYDTTNIYDTTDRTSTTISPKGSANGYEFLGWYYGESLVIGKDGKFTNDWNYTNLSSILGDAVYGRDEIELTAKWEMTTYTLVLHGNNGLFNDPASSGTLNVYGHIGDQITLDSIISLEDGDYTISRKGYTFAGWTENSEWSDSTGSYSVDYTYGSKFTFNDSSDDIHLYAVWIPNIVKVTLDFNDISNFSDPIYFNGETTETGKTTIDVYVKYGTREVYANRESFDAQHTNTYPYKPVGNQITPYVAMLGYKFVGWGLENGETYTQRSDANGLLTSIWTVAYYGADAGVDGVTLHAIWNLDSLPLFANANGGAFDVLANSWEYTKNDVGEYVDTLIRKPIPVGTAYGVIPTPVRGGYTFMGWATTANATEVNVNADTLMTADYESVTIYAVWNAEGYKIKYNIKEGETLVDAGGILEYSYTANTDLTLFTATKPGFGFIGWTATSTSGKSIGWETTTAGYTGHIGTGFWGDVTLTAEWDAEKYTINYDGNGADNGNMTSTQIVYNTTATLSNNEYSRTGYKFVGWSDTKDGEKVYENGASFTYTFPNDITVYAVWEPEIYRIDLEVGTGVTGGTRVVYLKYNTGFYARLNQAGNAVDESSVITEKIEIPVKNGYVFNGYYTSIDANGNGAETLIIGADGRVEPGKLTFTAENCTLYANWSGEVYTISLDLNGGTSVNVPNNTVYAQYANDKFYTTNGLETPILPYPTRNGYDFKGWQLDGVLITDDTGALLSAWSTSNETLTFTLIAKWEAMPVTLTINPNGGEIVQSAIMSVSSGYGLLDVNNMTVNFSANGSGSTYALSASSNNDPWAVLSYTLNLTAGTVYRMYAGLTDASGNAISGRDILTVYYGIDKTFTSANSVTFTESGWAEFAVSTSGIYNLRFDHEYMVGGTRIGADFNVVNFTIESSSKTSDAYTISAYCDDYINIPLPTKEGYTFSNWTVTTGSGTAIIATIEELMTIIKMGFNPTTMTANWSEAIYVITLDQTDATTASSPTTIYLRYTDGFYSNALATNTLTTINSIPKRDGYQFAGYYTDTTYSKQIIDALGAVNMVDGITTFTTSDCTLYAKWEPQEYILTFQMSEGESFEDDSWFDSHDTNYYKNYVVTDSLELPEPLKRGYSFVGWKVVLEDGNWKQLNDEGSAERIYAGTLEGMYGTVTLQAVWQANVYEITLNAGTDVVGNVHATKIYLKFGVGFFANREDAVNETNSISTIVAPTRTGFSFVGYYITVENKKEYIAIYDSVDSETRNPIASLQTNYTFTDEDIEVIAEYNPRKVSVDLFMNYEESTNSLPSFNGEIVEKTSVYIEYNSKNIYKRVGSEFESTEPVPDYRNGYSFGGWYTSPTGGKQVISSEG